MAHFIPEDKIAEIKHAADIVSIISETVALKKTGVNYSGLCPFHSEKTPSFTVSPDKGIFYCFGCGVGGDVFSFLMKKDGMVFPEAARELARRCGVDIPLKEMSPEQKRRMVRREAMLDLNRAAMEFFSGALGSPAGERARNYLKKRGIEEGLIRKFSLGHAPAGWDRLLGHFRRKGYPVGLAEQAGLLIAGKKRGGFYDRFRDRIIFPIFDVSGQVIGFGGRVMDDSVPKYLNSPESAVYAKSRSLYGLPMAKSQCRLKKTVFVAEGYFDVIALHQHGVVNSAATLGTALTPSHARLIRGLVGEDGVAVLVFDSDEAGEKAALKTVEMFQTHFIRARILSLAAGHDPDSFLFEYGPDAFVRAAEEAPDAMSFLMDSAVKKRGLSPEGKIRVIKDMKKPLAALKDSVDRAVYIQALSERLEMDESVILKTVQSRSEKAPTAKIFPGANAPGRDRADPDMSGGAPKEGRDPSSRIELKILSMMLQAPWTFPEIRRRRVVDDFHNETLKWIGNLILECREEDGRDPSDVIARMDDDETRRVFAAIAIESETWTREATMSLLEQFETLRRRPGENALSRKIKAAEKANDQALLLELLREKQSRAAGTGRPAGAKP
ncbi:DNA primase [Candidatus Desulfarcum epimagneticum]|uniref:DNA primase n=1 Tax=uncultured Desulfobacteraceae bacterium TaxID=218296 RepID=A0A484HLB2_9BACT|nr:DNA primase [uncultured Desulfobacteraceae bacterium]